jgi:hypothetical protein
MGSKKFKNKTCIYCGKENCSETGDHIFAREFFLSERRDNLPQCPACSICNNDKSKLEHYLTSILPFGAQHADAANNLENMVPGRLAKNRKLHQSLAAGMHRVWHQENGIIRPRLSLPLDSTKVNELFHFIVKGVLWHHWRVILTSNHFARAGTLSKEGEKVFWNLFNMNANARTGVVDLGEGTIQYEGIQGFDCPQLSVWKFVVYGGLKLDGDKRAPLENPSLIWGLTGRRSEQLPEELFFS